MSCWIIILLIFCCGGRNNACISDRRDCDGDCFDNVFDQNQHCPNSAFPGNTVCGCEVSEDLPEDADTASVVAPEDNVRERVYHGRLG